MVKVVSTTVKCYQLDHVRTSISILKLQRWNLNPNLLLQFSPSHPSLFLLLSPNLLLLLLRKMLKKKKNRKIKRNTKSSQEVGMLEVNLDLDT